MPVVLPSTVPPRVQKALQRLRASLYTPVTTLPVAAIVDGQQVPLTSFPHHWGRLWSEATFVVTLPKERPEEAWLEWNDQAEATGYIDGRAWYGFDVAHRCGHLPPDCRKVEIRAICAQTAIWHPGATGLDPRGSALQPPRLMARNEAAWVAYHDLLVLAELLHEECLAAGVDLGQHTNHSGARPDFPSLSLLGRRLLRGLDLALDAHDRGGAPGAREELAKLRQRLRGALPFRLTLTGHAHIDLVWLWPEAIGEHKAVHTFALADHLLGEYPEMHFGYSQPASYEAVARRDPELFGRVRQRLESGRWEATGALYVESDTQMACGEALARSFVLGQAGFRDLTGRPSDLLWLPDCFGFASCVPQLARLAGVSRFFTTKVFWSSVTQFPYQAFRWRGPDGSELVSYAHSERRVGYNGTASVRELREGELRQRQAAEFPEALVPTGYGDGGGGPTEEMAERARRCADLAGVPAAHWGRIDNFFDRLVTRADDLPRWDGEIYLQYHRGVFTTHHAFKAAFRGLERALQVAEAVAVVTGAGPIGDAAWKRLVFMQFHDFIPGSSILQVYTEGIAEARRLTAEARAAATARLNTTANAPEALFNPLPLAVPVRLADGRRATLPPLAGVPLAELVPGPTDPALAASATHLANSRLALTFNATGEIAAASLDGQPWPLLAGGELVLAPDKPHQYEAWDIDHPTATRLGERLAAPAWMLGASVTGDTAEVRFVRDLGAAGKVWVTYAMHAHEPRVHVSYEINLQASEILLKSVWRTDFHGQMARFGAPFGSSRRVQQPAGLRDEACWEGGASRWAMVADDSETAGWFVATEDLYGFAAADGVLSSTLLRSALMTAESSSSSHPHSLRDDLPERPFSDLGRHVLRLVVGPWQADLPRADQPAAVAETAFAELLPYCGPAVSTGFTGLTGPASLLPHWALPDPAGGWQLRLHETMGRRGTASLEGVRATAAVDLLHQPDSRPVLPAPNQITVRPYEIVTVRVERAGKEI